MRRWTLTLRVQEVADFDGMTVPIRLDGRIAKHLLLMTLRSDSHVLSSQRLHVRGDIRLLLFVS